MLQEVLSCKAVNVHLQNLHAHGPVFQTTRLNDLPYVCLFKLLPSNLIIYALQFAAVSMVGTRGLFKHDNIILRRNYPRICLRTAGVAFKTRPGQLQKTSVQCCSRLLGLMCVKSWSGQESVRHENVIPLSTVSIPFPTADRAENSCALLSACDGQHRLSQKRANVALQLLDAVRTLNSLHSITSVNSNSVRSFVSRLR